MNDFRFALRQLCKSPGFTSLAIMTLALGIGVNSAIFALVNGAVLRPMVPLRPAEVVNIFTARQNTNHDYRQFSHTEYRELRANGGDLFADFAALEFAVAGIGRDHEIIKTKCNGNPRVFDQEYPKDPKSCFLASGNPVFDSDSLAHLQVLSRKPIEYGQLNQIGSGVTWVPCSDQTATSWRWEPPKVGCTYLIVADLAEGEDQTKGQDPDRHSVLVLRKAYRDQDEIQHRMKVVARIRPPNRLPIYALVDLVWLLHIYYGRCVVIPEMNNSGAAFILGARAKGIPIWQRQDIDPHSGKRRYDGWRTTDTREYGGLRSAIIWRLHEVLRNKELDCNCPHIVSELADFVDKGGRMEAASGHDDDCLALAIGVFNIESATTYIEPITVTRLPPDLAALEREEEANARLGMAMRW
jgi:hypothetical protein